MSRWKWLAVSALALSGLVVGGAVPSGAQTERRLDEAVDDVYVEPGPIDHGHQVWTGAQLRKLRELRAQQRALGIEDAGATCDSGANQIEFLYGVPSDNASQSTRVGTIRSDAAAMQLWLRREAGPRRDQTFRFCTTGGVLAVTEVALPAVGPDGEIASLEMRNALSNAGYYASDRKYVIYVELDAGENVNCGDSVTDGCASGLEDDQSPSYGNRNNTSTGYAFVVAGTSDRLRTAMHELFHVLGAVQLEAPGYSSQHHTKTGVEIMTGGPTQYHCDPGPNPLEDSLTIDCGHDDYYSTLCAVDKYRCPGHNGTYGTLTYIANAFNIAEFSLYLGPISSTPLDAMTCFTATPTVLEEHSESWSGGAANEAVHAGDGFDLLQGFGGTDHLCGSQGNDNVQGGSAGDFVAGGGGMDTVRGGDANDTVRGNDHDDMLYDGMGTDTVEGGTGIDTLYQCADGVSDNVTGVENIVAASSGYC